MGTGWEKADGPFDRGRRPGFDVRRLSRLQRHPVRAGRGSGGRAVTDPAAVPPISPACSWRRWSASSKLLPCLSLGAVFGKVIELSGFSKSIVSAVIGLVGRERAMLSIVLVGALLTYGGVSLFVVVFAVYPFAAEMFRQSDIPKRLIPARSPWAHSPSRWIRCPDAADPEHHPDDLLQDQHLGGPVARHDRRHLHPSAGSYLNGAAVRPRRRRRLRRGPNRTSPNP